MKVESYNCNGRTYLSASDLRFYGKKIQRNFDYFDTDITDKFPSIVNSDVY